MTQGDCLLDELSCQPGDTWSQGDMDRAPTVSIILCVEVGCTKTYENVSQKETFHVIVKNGTCIAGRVP